MELTEVVGGDIEVEGGVDEVGWRRDMAAVQ